MPVLTDLSGKVAVVTGGASGMGKGIAEALLSAGMQVVIVDIDQAALERTGEELGVPAYQLDVRDYKQVAHLAEVIAARFGAIHVVCNNAGVGPIGPIESMTLEDWGWVLDINLWGVIHGVKAFLPFLKSNPDGGHIVNTSSMSGLMPGAGFGAYTVSKYGVVALTEVLALELAQESSSVRTSVLLPGPTQTSIATGLRNRGSVANSGLSDLDLRDVDLFGGPIPWKSPREIGDVVLRGLRTGELYLFTHPGLSAPIFARFADIEHASNSAPRQ